jgi:hypothetical protein
MAVNIMKVRGLYESYRGQPGGRGRLAFRNTLRQQLGLCDQNGNDYRNRNGDRCVKNAQLKPEDFSLQELAEAVVGPAWRVFFDPTNEGSLQQLASHNRLVESQYVGDNRALLEATGVGVDPGAFLDINTFTAVVGGLVEVKILENFQSPKFIADELMPVEQTKLNGQKIINAARIGDKAIRRQPGEPHARAVFGERFVSTPATRENALAIDVTKEAVFYDLTGNVLNVAGDVGEWLGYRKELDVIDAFIGVTSGSSGVSALSYMGTAYGMYSTSQTIGKSTIINQQSNDLLDWTAIESSWLLSQRMTDPETATRIGVMYDTILVNPAKLNTAILILGAIRTEVRTTGGNTQATAPTLQIRDTPSAPYTNASIKVLSSPLVEQRCTDASGLNLSQANANKYWWHFQKGRPFRYMQNWPLTTWQFSGNQYEMLDKGIVATYGANERGIAASISPWHVVENTN